MRRRDLISLIGGAAVAWPLAARAQQPAPGKWHIGILTPEFRQKPLREGLRELGYVEGQNLIIDWRFDERTDRLASFATELVGLSPDLIVANGTQAALAAQRATERLPIVMMASDPIGDGLVKSLAHPGGNITGLSLQTPEMSGKRLELLLQAHGKLSSIAVLYNSDDPPALNALKETLEAARGAGLQAATVAARSPADMTSAFETITQLRPDALIVLGSPLMSGQAGRIADFAVQLKLPSIYSDPLFARAGGFMSYGPDYNRTLEKLATFIDRIFKGSKPADLPVEQPSKFELVINLKTAKVLGGEIPPNLLALADEVIE